jgi:2-(1,2-epoxy-1,2-dihydrophenyl)acetyl-CoA isomerase
MVQEIIMFDTVLYEVKDNIATITFNRPEKGNAFIKESYSEVRDAIEAASVDSSVRAIVLTGAGKHFSAGGDINRFKTLIQSGEYLQEENISAAGQMASAIRFCPKPVIAMINGAAAAAGCSLAMACDFRVVTPKSKLSMAFIKLGLSGDTGGMYYLQKLVGIAKTTQLMMMGDVVAGEEALKLGLATVLAEEGKLEEATYELAAKLAASATFAITRQKQLMNEIFYADLAGYSAKESFFMAECSRTADFAESVDAFLEKRQPKFIGA